MFKQLNKNKSNLIIFFIILYVFIVSSNIAWLNPKPELTQDYYPDDYSRAPGIYKINEKIPLFWQYSADSGVEILTATYFPLIFNTYKTRIDRPTYPIIINILGKTIGTIAKPFKVLSPLEKTGIAYILFKFFVYLSSSYLMYNILNRFISNKNISLLAVLITYTHPHSIFYATTFHTSELQFITPIITIYFFLNLKENYSNKNNIFYSIIFGCLMLAKQNYAVYLAIAFLSIYHKHWKEIFISFAAHLIPLLIYIYYLNSIGFEYFNYGMQSEYGQLTWIFNELPKRSFIGIIDSIFFVINHFIISLARHYSIWIFLFTISLVIAFTNKNINKNIFIFILLFIFINFIQCFVAKRYLPYMTSDISIIIYPFVSIIIYEMLSCLRNINLRNVAKYSIVFIIFITSITSNAHFLDWVHPYDQKSRNTEILSERLHMIENPNLYTDKDRKDAKDQKLLNKYELK